MPVDAADLVARAYGRPAPSLPALPMTYGLALVLLVSRNTSRERCLPLGFLADQVHAAVCVPAEAFAGALEPGVLEDEQRSRGWRGGAVAGLRALAGSSLHYCEDGHLCLWAEDDAPLSGPAAAPLRNRLIRDLAPHPRASAAWDELIRAFHGGRVNSEGQTPAQVLGSGGCLHERPADTQWLRSQLLGRDPQADLLDRMRNGDGRG
jgi:hypothetical protein